MKKDAFRRRHSVRFVNLGVDSFEQVGIELYRGWEEGNWMPDHEIDNCEFYDSGVGDDRDALDAVWVGGVEDFTFRDSLIDERPNGVVFTLAN